jgi:two-component system, OmpR family, alkaline phosphatase synthesis response regulator PhoP
MREFVLIAEDDAKTAATIHLYLKHAGYESMHARDGIQALRMIRSNAPDLIILDLMLPGNNGWNVCREVRAFSDVPILMLTARSQEEDKLKGLEMGADDYVTKPFSPRELVARVRAVLRRAERSAEPSDRIVVGDLVLDVPRLRSTAAGRSIELTATEFAILATMARDPGRVFTRSQLLDAVHGVAFEAYERAIDAHVKNIRRKLEPDPARPRYLLTVYGVGYRVAEPDAD